MAAAEAVVVVWRGCCTALCILVDTRPFVTLGWLAVERLAGGSFAVGRRQTVGGRQRGECESGGAPRSDARCRTAGRSRVVRSLCQPRSSGGLRGCARLAAGMGQGLVEQSQGESCTRLACSPALAAIRDLGFQDSSRLPVSWPRAVKWRGAGWASGCSSARVTILCGLAVV